MQEDKSSKWLAEQLRKRQEENRLPYELGAWEAFEIKRKATNERKSIYWLSGVAAAIVLLFVAGGLWLAQDSEQTDLTRSGQLALEKLPAVNPTQEAQTTEPKIETTEPLESADLNLDKVVANNAPPSASVMSIPAPSFSQSAKSGSTKADVSTPVSVSTESITAVETPIKEENAPRTIGMETLIATNDKMDQGNAANPSVKKEEHVGAVLSEEPQLSDEEIADILTKKSFASIAMGLSPGVGSSSGSDQTTAGTSLGLGVMVDMAIAGKLVMGSGLAVNYLNQASESQSYNYGGANALSAQVTETEKISQVQLDIPLYFKYPITRNEKISVQAGFSNLITFNQDAAQESSYTRQVAVYDATAASGFTLKSESVNQNQDLNVSNQQFYPFATANFGVNIRLFEAKKTNYEVMPFYNYPLQEFSGYGEKLGMFGASFKVNFGAVKGK